MSLGERAMNLYFPDAWMMAYSLYFEREAYICRVQHLDDYPPGLQGRAHSIFKLDRFAWEYAYGTAIVNLSKTPGVPARVYAHRSLKRLSE